MDRVMLTDTKGHEYGLESTLETIPDGPRLKWTIRTATGAKVLDLAVETASQRDTLVRMLNEL